MTEIKKDLKVYMENIRKSRKVKKKAGVGHCRMQERSRVSRPKLFKKEEMKGEANDCEETKNKHLKQRSYKKGKKFENQGGIKCGRR